MGIGREGGQPSKGDPPLDCSNFVLAIAQLVHPNIPYSSSPPKKNPLGAPQVYGKTAPTRAPFGCSWRSSRKSEPPTVSHRRLA